MSNIESIVVQITTSKDAPGGTDDFFYIGVHGTNGGREFCLDSPKNDLEAGSVNSFIIGKDNVLANPNKRVPIHAGADTFDHY